MLSNRPARFLQIHEERMQTAGEDLFDTVVHERLIQLARQPLRFVGVGIGAGAADGAQRLLQRGDIEANRPRMLRMQDQQLGDALRFDA